MSDHGGTRGWLGAVGQREEGSRQDFYERLRAECATARTASFPQGVDTSALLPQEWDRKRLAVEAAYAEQRMYADIMIRATAKSLRCGEVVQAEFGSFAMGALVRADKGEQYVAFIARNIFDAAKLAVMMAALPGVDPTDWAPEPGGFADLRPRPGEIIWSALLSPDASEAILDQVPWED